MKLVGQGMCSLAIGVKGENNWLSCLPLKGGAKSIYRSMKVAVEPASKKRIFPKDSGKQMY
jgi:hypothetical protein